MPSDQTNPSEWAMAQARSIWPANLKSVARLLDAAVAERDEAVKVLAEHMAAREKHETGPTVHTLHVLNVACFTVEENPIASAALVAARAAVDAANAMEGE